MTNEQKYKTAEERVAAFEEYCYNRPCSQCKYDDPKHHGTRLFCPFNWLADEYKEPKQDLPFKAQGSNVFITEGNKFLLCC